MEVAVLATGEEIKMSEFSDLKVKTDVMQDLIIEIDSLAEEIAELVKTGDSEKINQKMEQLDAMDAECKKYHKACLQAEQILSDGKEFNETLVFADGDARAFSATLTTVHAVKAKFDGIDEKYLLVTITNNCDTYRNSPVVIISTDYLAEFFTKKSEMLDKIRDIKKTSLK